MYLLLNLFLPTSIIIYSTWSLTQTKTISLIFPVCIPLQLQDTKHNLQLIELYPTYLIPKNVAEHQHPKMILSKGKRALRSFYISVFSCLSVKTCYWIALPQRPLETLKFCDVHSAVQSSKHQASNHQLAMWFWMRQVTEPLWALVPSAAN